MKKLIILFLSISVSVLTSCGSGKSSSQGNIEKVETTETTISDYDPFEIPSDISENVVQAQFGFGLTEPAVNGEIPYSSEKKMGFYINNTGSASSFTVLLYVDGIRQSYSLDSGTEKATHHVVQVAKDERKEFYVTYNPTAGEFKENTIISYAIMYNPEFAPQSPTVLFGNNYGLSFFNFKLSGISKDITLVKNIIKGEKTTIPNDILQKYMMPDSSGAGYVNTLENSARLVALKNDNMTIESDPHPNAVCSSDTLTVRILGGAECEYRVSMYVDHKLISAFNGFEYIDMESSVNEMSEFSIALSELKLPESGYHSLYFIAVPINDTEATINMSSPMVFCGKDVTG